MRKCERVRMERGGETERERETDKEKRKKEKNLAEWD